MGIQPESGITPGSNITNIRLGMQPSKPAAHGLQIFFAESAFDAREYFVLLKAHMIVEYFREAGLRFKPDGQFFRAQTLQIPHRGAYLRMLGQQANCSPVLI